MNTSERQHHIYQAVEAYVLFMHYKHEHMSIDRIIEICQSHVDTITARVLAYAKAEQIGNLAKIFKAMSRDATFKELDVAMNKIKERSKFKYIDAALVDFTRNVSYSRSVVKI